MRSIRNYFLHDIPDFRKLIHEVYPVMQTAGSINKHDIRILCDSRTDRIKGHGNRI